MLPISSRQIGRHLRQPVAQLFILVLHVPLHCTLVDVTDMNWIELVRFISVPSVDADCLRNYLLATVNRLYRFP